MDFPNFDLGIPLDSSKRKRTKREVKKKLMYTNAYDAALNLGFASSISPDSFACLSSFQDFNRASVVDVSPNALAVSSVLCSFLPDTGDEDEEKSAASVGNDRWFQNHFNEFLIHIKHEPLFPSMYMYSWEVLGSNLLPQFCKCLLKRDGSRYPLGSINNFLNACQRILRDHQRSQRASLISQGLPVLPRLNIRTNSLFVRTIDCFESAMRKSVKEQGNQPRHKVDIFTPEQEQMILSHPEHSIHHVYGLQKRWAFHCCSEFIVRGQGELHKLEIGQFSEVHLDGVPTVRYVETDSKNNRIDLRHTQIEDMHEPCYSQNPDVLITYQALMSHMPLVDRSSHIFLQPISNPVTKVWYKQNVNVSKQVLGTIVASMAGKVGLRGDFTNKSLRSTSISRMIAMGVPENVIQTVTGHKNPKSLRRYDQTAIIRHLSAQQASRMHGGISYEDLLCVNIEIWRRKNGLEATPLSSGNLNQLGGSVIMELSKLFEECSNYLVLDSPVCSSFNSIEFETCCLSPSRESSSPPAPWLVPSCSSNPIGHLRSCVFDPCEHLLLYPTNSVIERYDAIDRHFPVLESPVRNVREVIDLDSFPPSGSFVSSAFLTSADQTSSGSGNRLCRAERNLLMAQRKRAQSKHSFSSELQITSAVNRNEAPRNFVRKVSDYSELSKKRREETALIYEQLKRSSVCAEAGWDRDMLLASLTDLDCVQNVAVALAIPPAQLSAPLSSALPISVSAGLVERPSAVLTGCVEGGASGNVSSAGNLSSIALPAPVLSQQPTNSSQVESGGHVDQNNSFSGPIQYFFNIGGINCDPSMPIGDFLSSLARVATSGSAGTLSGQAGCQPAAGHN